MDIILRDCGRVGWLGIVMVNGSETYRTGKHHLNKESVLYAVDSWLYLKEQEEHERSLV